METLFDSLITISHSGIGFVVNSLAIGLVLTGLILLLWHWVRPYDAAVSYKVWWVILASLVLFPAVTYWFDSPQQSNVTAELSGQSSIIKTEASEKLVTPVEENLPPVHSHSAVLHEPSRSAIASDRTVERETSHAVASSRRPAGEVLVGIAPLSLFVLWAVVSAALLLRVFRSYRRVREIKINSRRIDTSKYPLFERIKRRTQRGIRTWVAESDMVDLPAAAGLGRPVILIPTELKEELSDNALEGILIHELMHLERHDDYGRLAQAVIRALLFFHPAVYWISGQLDVEREIACDDRVVDLTGRAREYAESLSRLAEITVANRTTLIPGALEDRKQLFRRFKRLLGDKPAASARNSRYWLAGAIGVMVMTLVLAIQIGPVKAFPRTGISFADLSALVTASPKAEAQKHAEPEPTPIKEEPARPQPIEEGAVEPNPVPAPTESEPVPTPPARPISEPRLIEEDNIAPAATLADLDSPLERLGHWVGEAFSRNLIGTSVTHEDDGTTTFRWSDGHSELRARMYGKIEFADDDHSIKSISRDGFLTIEERRRRDRKELDVEAGAGGKLIYTYLVNGKAQTFDEDGEAWLSEVLIDIIRRTGFGAEERTDRIFARDGVGGVLKEVHEIESSYVSRLYLEALLVRHDLKFEDWTRVLREVPKQLDSDYETAELLIAIAPQAEKDPGRLEAWVNCVEQVDSDYETRRVLSEIELDRNTPPEVVKAVLQIATNMDSDYEKAELAISEAALIDADPVLSSAYISVVESIDSDYEKRRVLSEISLDDSASPDAIQRCLRIAEGMDSDYEKAELLLSLAPLLDSDTMLTSTYVNAAVNLDSDYELKRVVSGLADRNELSPESLERLLDLVSRMESDYEKAEAMIDISRRSRDREVNLKLMDAARMIDSDYERRRTIDAFDIDCRRDEGNALALLRAIDEMNGDYDRAEALLGIVDCVEASDSTWKAFLEATDAIDSDYDRGRVYNQLLRSSEPNDQQVIDLLRMIDRMSSDYDKAQILNTLVRRCRGNEELEDAFTSVLDGFSSDSEANELYAKLYRRNRRDQDESK